MTAVGPVGADASPCRARSTSPSTPVRAVGAQREWSCIAPGCLRRTPPGRRAPGELRRASGGGCLGDARGGGTGRSIRRPRSPASAAGSARRASCGTSWRGAPRLSGRAELARLVELLADGCQSELEIWGCLQVLRAPGMPSIRAATPAEGRRGDLRAGRRVRGIDAGGRDGRGGLARRREPSGRPTSGVTRWWRPAGWQTLRFSFARMTRSPEACRRDIGAVHAARVRLLHGGAGR